MPSSGGSKARSPRSPKYRCYDVKVTKCVHEYGIQHGHVKYHDRNGREQTVNVDWK